MCVIFACEDSLPSEEMIRRAYNHNKHGAGVAWRDGNLVRWRKGLSLERLLSLQVTAPAIYHFRIATVGGHSNELTHPFPISRKSPVHMNGEASKVLFHNGHWTDWKKYLCVSASRKNRLPPGPWSDSRALAWLAYNAGESFLDIVASEDFQKIATLDRDGILRYGNWIKIENMWASNDTFLPIKVYAGKEWDNEKHDYREGRWVGYHGGTGHKKKETEESKKNLTALQCDHGASCAEDKAGVRNYSFVGGKVIVTHKCGKVEEWDEDKWVTEEGGAIC